MFRNCSYALSLANTLRCTFFTRRQVQPPPWTLCRWNVFVYNPQPLSRW